MSSWLAWVDNFTGTFFTGSESPGRSSSVSENGASHGTAANMDALSNLTSLARTRLARSSSDSLKTNSMPGSFPTPVRDEILSPSSIVQEAVRSHNNSQLPLAAAIKQEAGHPSLTRITWSAPTSSISHTSITSAGTSKSGALFLPGALLSLPGDDIQVLVRKQCSGITKDNKRCLSNVDLTEDQILTLSIPGELRVFCRKRHYRTEQEDTNCPANLVNVDVSDWIPPYLSEQARSQLQAKMLEPISPGEGPGMLYILEIDDSQTDTVQYKVGRTNNVERRPVEWDQRCGVKTTTRYFYPNDGTGDPPLRGKTRKNGSIPCSSKAERLVHLELMDLVRSEIYLDAGWPNANLSLDHTRGDQRYIHQNPRCPRCTKRHKEVFVFKRLGGDRRGREWEIVVKPIIERWAHFVCLLPSPISAPDAESV